MLDTNTGRDIALLEAAADFMERYKAAHPEHTQGGVYIEDSINFWEIHLFLWDLQARFMPHVLFRACPLPRLESCRQNVHVVVAPL